MASQKAHLYRKHETEGQHYFELYNETEKLLLVSEKYDSAHSRDHAIAVLSRCGKEAKCAEPI